MFQSSFRRSLARLATASKRRRHKYSVMTMARWETPYINEFVEYYRSIGFDHIYLYCNDDDPGELYTEVAPYVEACSPFVTFVHYPYQGQQWWILLHFLRTYKQETEWVALFDVDEFLSLRDAPDIHSFMTTRLGDTDSIYFHWLFFGHNGFEEPPIGSVLRNYTRREPFLNMHTKTMTRTSKIELDTLKHDVRKRDSYILPHHGWNAITATHMRCRDVLGNDMIDYYGNLSLFAEYYQKEGAIEQLYRTAALHHYAFKSRSCAVRRFRRGLAGEFQNQQMWKARSENGELDELLALFNTIEDTTLKDYWEAYLRRRTEPLSLMQQATAPLVSQDRPALQSSVLPGSRDPPEVRAARALAGRVSGRPSFQTDHEPEPWWQVDLEDAYSLAEVRLYNRTDDLEAAASIARFRILASLDGENWREVFAKLDGEPFGGADGAPFRWRPSPSVVARHVRVRLVGAGSLSLDHVEVYGLAADGRAGSVDG